jgi:hypothetical protein
MTSPPTGAATGTPARSSPARPGNAYVREDQILPHLAAIAILLAAPVRAAGARGPGSRGRAELAGPDSTAELIDQLRAGGTVLTYDPEQKTLRAGGRDAPAVTIGTGTARTRSCQDRERRTAQERTDRSAPAVATGKDH